MVAEGRGANWILICDREHKREKILKRLDGSEGRLNIACYSRLSSPSPHFDLSTAQPPKSSDLRRASCSRLRVYSRCHTSLLSPQGIPKQPQSFPSLATRIIQAQPLLHLRRRSRIAKTFILPSILNCPTINNRTEFVVVPLVGCWMWQT